MISLCQEGQSSGRALSHRIPLVDLKCVSPKRRKEIAARLGGEPGGAPGVDSQTESAILKTIVFFQLTLLSHSNLRPCSLASVKLGNSSRYPLFPPFWSLRFRSR